MSSFTSRIHPLFDNVPLEQAPLAAKQTTSSKVAVVEDIHVVPNLEVSATLSSSDGLTKALSALDLTDAETDTARQKEKVDHEEMVEKAKEAIIERAVEKIHDNDTILIYGFSEIVKDLFLAAIHNGKKFSVIILEENNKLEANNDSEKQHALKLLSPELKQNLLSITHTHLNSLSFVIRKVTKLFLFPHGLLSNGHILGRVGTAQIALMASSKNIPVIVCCETFKFFDKLPTDSFFQNERASADNLLSKVKSDTSDPKLESEEAKQNIGKYLKTFVLKYDVTPSKFITAIITEVDIFPATSIPLLLHVQENRSNMMKKKTTVNE